MQKIKIMAPQYPSFSAFSHSPWRLLHRHLPPFRVHRRHLPPVPLQPPSVVVVRVEEVYLRPGGPHSGVEGGHVQEGPRPALPHPYDDGGGEAVVAAGGGRLGGGGGGGGVGVSGGGEGVREGGVGGGVVSLVRGKIMQIHCLSTSRAFSPFSSFRQFFLTAAYMVPLIGKVVFKQSHTLCLVLLFSVIWLRTSMQAAAADDEKMYLHSPRFCGISPVSRICVQGAFRS